MSTERPPASRDEVQARERLARRKQILWLCAMVLLALAMAVELLQTGGIRWFWSVLTLLLTAAYFWRGSRLPRAEQAQGSGQVRVRHRSGRGQRPMIWLAGAVLTAFAIMNEVQATGDRGPLWRVFVAILAFLYLWWLSSLLFDLAFVWHRYIQGDAAHRFLRETVQRKDFNPKNDSPGEPPSSRPADLPPLHPSGGSSSSINPPATY